MKPDPKNQNQLKPFQPETNDPAEYWLWLAQVLGYFEQTIPLGFDPQICDWDDPDEDWKNPNSERALERRHAQRVSQALVEFVQSGHWPKTSSVEPYYARLRLEFAQRQAKLFATKSSIVGECPVALSTKKHRANLLWLLIDLYSAHKGLQ